MREKAIELIHSSGLSRVADNLVDLLWDSLRLETRPLSGEPQVGASRIGGTPDLPPGMSWPEWKGVPQSFIAQLNLAEVAAVIDDQGGSWQSSSATQIALPSSGMIYFFYAASIGQTPWGFDPKDRGGWKVAYFTGPMESLLTVPLPDAVPQEVRFSPCTVGFKRDITLPGWESYWIEQLQLTKEERDLYFDLEDDLAELVGSSECTNRLLGHADEVQGDMLLECQLVSHGLYCGSASGYEDPRRQLLESGATNWRLLLQIDSDDNAGMMWGDVGRIYYWIGQDALAAHQFDETWLILQCG